MKGKKLLLSMLTLAMLGTATVGGSILVANAAGGPTVGAFYEAWSGTKYSINGTSATESENKTVISYQWSAVEYNRLLVHVTGATAESTVEVALKPDADMGLQIWSCNGEGDWGPAYGIKANETITADTLYETTFTLSGLTETELYLGFYFDSGVTTDTVKSVVVEKLTVDGVSYQKAPYTAPVETPDVEFEAQSDWTATNATVSANTLERLPETDPQYEGAVDNGAGKITLTDSSAPATVEIPLTGAISTWPTAWTHLHVKAQATGIASVAAYIDAVVPHEGESTEAHLFCGDILGGGWNADSAKSSTEGYRLLDVSSLSTFFSRYLNGGSDEWDTVIAHPSIEKIVLLITPEEGASAAELDIAGMAFGGATAPAFINDAEYVPGLEIGEWITWSGYTVENDATLEVGEETTYTGVKVSYAYSELQAYPNVESHISNFDPADHPMLHIGFYTDSAMTLGVAVGWDLITATMPFEAGYHEVSVDMSAFPAGAFDLRLYIDNGTAEFEGTKTVLIDSVVFHKEVEILADEAYAPLNDTVITTADGKLVVAFDAKNGGFDNYVSIPVENWYSFNRVLHLNVTLSHAMAVGVWGSTNSFGDPETLQMTHKVLPAGTYDFWLDASSTTFADNGKANNIMIYSDVSNATEGSFVKTLTINTMEFVSGTTLVSSPNGNVVTVNYSEGKATYDATAYEVATDKDFEHAFASGSAVTPGMKLYIRKVGGTSVTELVLPVTVLTEDMITFSTITDKIIRTNSFANYEFKLGEDGEWMEGMGTWGNLEANTEYTIYVRIKATETAFASEEISIKVKTLAASGSTTPGDGDTTPGDTTPGGDKTDDGEKKGCKSVIGIVGGATAIGILLMGTAVVLFARKKKED